MSQATIIDVAKKANVSTATVSRVINNNYPVKPETRKAVERAMRELSFEINRNAHNLKRNYSKMIGIIVADISNPFFMTIAKGLENTVNPAGYTIVYASSDEAFEKEIQILKTFCQYRIDGVVLATCGNRADLINEVLDTGMPGVIVDSLLTGVHADIIAENDRHAMYDLTSYVIRNGHRNICMINGDIHKSTGIARYQGFLDAMEYHGIRPREELVLDGSFVRKTAAEGFESLLNRKDIPPFTAVVCANNFMTEGVLSVLISRGIHIPEDISVASYNEISLPGLFRPQITHLSDNTYEIGKCAGELLMCSLDKKKNKTAPIMRAFNTIYFEKKLVEGGSVKQLEE